MPTGGGKTLSGGRPPCPTLATALTRTIDEKIQILLIRVETYTIGVESCNNDFMGCGSIGNAKMLSSATYF